MFRSRSPYPSSSRPLRSRTFARVAVRAAVLGLAVTASAATAHAEAAAPSAHAAAPAPAQAQARDTEPVSVRALHTGPEIHRFLTWFYGERGPTPQQRERHVSAFLKDKQARNPGHDVILCAQNTPRDLAIGPVTVARSAGFGWAPVTAYWEDGTTSTSTAYVALDSQPIELHDVMCAD